ncbi:hypothetical protein DPV92_06760 [Haemophilus paraphrohaemolyticus]|uniref:Uncharacterized protein n=1 Tax=Haemophilus paraphrohaemolyticus TaxID=736 RepID=A0A369ZMM0_9PAST|nr:hypothetical protein [Haemophilus paraphrohaemolyticus]RDF09885.1 hypothetical protein DPV92_06760 [Haemophilus paraphrohaemolyticus]
MGVNSHGYSSIQSKNIFHQIKPTPKRIGPQAWVYWVSGQDKRLLAAIERASCASDTFKLKPTPSDTLQSAAIYALPAQSS